MTFTEANGTTPRLRPTSNRQRRTPSQWASGIMIKNTILICSEQPTAASPNLRRNYQTVSNGVKSDRAARTLGVLSRPLDSEQPIGAVVWSSAVDRSQ